MATQKTWTAYDITMGAVRISYDYSADTISATQGYSFVDDAGNVVDALPNRTVKELTEFSALPQDVQDAVLKLRDYMYDKALNQEGMS